MATSNLGYGGVDYNSAEAELKKKIAQNQANIASNSTYRDSETQRALQVIAQREAQGLDTSAQKKYLTQNLGYKAPTNPSTNTNTNMTTASTTTKSNSQQGSDLMEMMRQIASREMTPFSYDANSDPAYQAALKRAQANIDQGNSAAQAEMNRRGILNSTITSDRMGEIASQEMGRVETDVLPSLMQQAYQKYLDQENMKQQQFANYGNLAQMYLSEDQRGIDNTNTRAQLTGYLPGGEQAQSLVSQLMGLKQQAETPGITAAERTKLSNQADGIRAMLSGMGVDTSQYGANANYSTASQYTPMIRTLAGQQFDQAKQAQAFEQNFAQEQFAYQKIRDQISDEKWKKEFDEDSRRFGLQYALSRQVQLGGLSIDRARLALSQAAQENDRLMDIWKATGKAPEGIRGVIAGTQYGTDSTNASGVSEKMLAEAQGMVQSVREGKYTPESAYKQIEEDTQLGFYTASEAQYLKSMLEQVSRSAPKVKLSEEDQQKLTDSFPTDKELNKLWETEGKKLGAGKIDFKSWYKSPQGRSAGTDFKTWKRLYGPTIQ